MQARKSVRGICGICKEVNVTNYHYGVAHGLRPRLIFPYSSATKMWSCHRHRVQSLDPHKMMGHYWREHIYSHPKKLPYKTREPRGIRPTLKEEKPVSKKPTLEKETPVGIVMRTATTTLPDIPQHPPITAEAIVNAFEARVKTIDEQLEAKDKIISEQAKLISAAWRKIDETTKELNAVKSELLNRKPLEEPTPTKTDGLVGRLFKR